eukprot:TRINITY_DN22375_c0_g1_i1.p1 TRINITY_DN22375_c0_g1~~TRINITY_DN22375_c0_g1_i1.p1  ORF type:complete len:489 (+),score=98.52 TRINITY_DN22375_c0_g1_i1:184-1467(+)
MSQAFMSSAACGALVAAVRNNRRRRMLIRCYSLGNCGGSRRPKTPMSPRADLFLQLPFGNGVLLSGMFAEGLPKIHMLPPPSALPPLAIVPVVDRGAACVPFAPGSSDSDEVTELRQRLFPGPLKPVTPRGRALQRAMQAAPEHFDLLNDYELMRAAIHGSGDVQVDQQAEALLLSVYARFNEAGGAPPRPACDCREDYEMYAKTFGAIAVQAQESICSIDFCVIAKAHVIGLAQTACFPRLERMDARSMYSSAMRFGHALRQAEVRFLAENSAGTFVPLSLEAELLREELEAAWSLPPASSSTSADSGDHGAPSSVSDAEAAQRSLEQVLSRLNCVGEARPGLATYLGWLGKFDPEALSLLSTPSPVVARAMQMQVAAVWGEPKRNNSEVKYVATTPADMLEAIAFGAWLRDAATSAEEASSRHRQ